MMHIIAIISMIFTMTMVIGFMWLCKWADKPWVMARKGNYRIHMVHGDMWVCWKYRLEKKGLLGWGNLDGEPSCTKDSNRYNEWIEKYKLRVC